MIGTLNAIIFYANIVAANKSAFFPSGVSPASVFISWLNLDLGFDACFFDGMDTYIKIWLQLAFPAYIINYPSSDDNRANSAIISMLLGVLLEKKIRWPCTLATLILLFYTKLLPTDHHHSFLLCHSSLS